jgi:hypothetical protein
MVAASTTLRRYSDRYRYQLIAEISRAGVVLAYVSVDLGRDLASFSVLGS